MGFFKFLFYILSLTLEVYLWCNLQTSVFLKWDNWHNESQILPNTFLPHCVCITGCILWMYFLIDNHKTHTESFLPLTSHRWAWLSVLLSISCKPWSEFRITTSSFLKASSSVPPFVRAPCRTRLFSSSFSCWLSRMNPGMQIMNEIVRRLKVSPT